MNTYEWIDTTAHDWVKLDTNNNLLDRDANLCSLVKRNTLPRVIYTKNWFKPVSFSLEPFDKKI